MSRVYPEIVVLLDGEAFGALDIKHTDFHVAILASRAMSFGDIYSKNTRYQLRINNGGLTHSYFVKEYCQMCSSDHYVIKDLRPYNESGYFFDAQETFELLNVKLLRDSTPFTVAPDMYIYNDLKFICM